MKKIIAATDFSPVAENAVAYAASIAKQTGSELILYNAFVVPVHAANAMLPADGIQELLEQRKNRLEAKALLLAAVYDIKVRHEANFSFIEDELLLLIRKYKADLLVLGMPAKTLEQDLWGNTTTAAIKKLKFPVLAVPAGARPDHIKKVLFACDVLGGLSDKVLLSIRELAALFNAEVEVFNVDQKVEVLQSEASPEVFNALDEGLDGISYYYKNVKSNTVIKAIESEIKAFEADILIMVPKKYGFWSSIVHKSKTRTMASGLDIPLLSIPV